MDMTPRPYRAVCFDLDGTLLPMDIDEFMQGYFSSIVRFAASRGFDAEGFLTALKAGIKAMATHDGARTNEDVFWEAFGAAYGACADEIRASIGDYYNGAFTAIGKNVVPNPATARAIEALRSKGYPLMLTTMPMFPRCAVEQRLRWAGVDPAAFERITTYENSTSVKPRQTYYAENLAAMGAPDALSGKDVLMVGNNTMEDLAFCDMGADAFLVTDCLLNPIDLDLGTVRHGTMEEFAAWAETLPVCADPIGAVQQGAVTSAAMEAAFAANAVAPIDREAATSAAAAVAQNAVDEHASGKVACGVRPVAGADQAEASREVR